MLSMNVPSSKVLTVSAEPNRLPCVQCSTSTMDVQVTGPRTAAVKHGLVASSPEVNLRKSTCNQVRALKRTLRTTGSQISELNELGPMSRMQAALAYVYAS